MLVTSAQSMYLWLLVRCSCLVGVRDAKQEHPPRGQDTGCATQPGMQTTYKSYFQYHYKYVLFVLGSKMLLYYDPKTRHTYNDIEAPIIIHF